MAEASNDTFISYRRDASWTLVEALYQRLTEAGIDCFYDIADIRAGKFEDVILNQIRARPYFLLVLTPGTLEGCEDPDDWLRREIEVAIESDRVIVPVYTPVFDLGSLRHGLPDGLGRTIAGYQAQELPHKFFKYAVAELAEEYLVPTDRDVTPAPVADRPEVDRLRKAAADTETVTREQLSGQEFFERGKKKYEADDYDGAIVDLDEAIRLDPNNASAYNSRGAAWYGKGEFDRAITDYDEALRLDPDNADAIKWRTEALKNR